MKRIERPRFKSVNIRRIRILEIGASKICAPAAGVFEIRIGEIRVRETLAVEANADKADRMHPSNSQIVSIVSGARRSRAWVRARRKQCGHRKFG